MGETGRAILTDFEGVANGPREWDLATVAMSRARFGLPEKAYEGFCQRYGFDVMAWDGYGVCCVRCGSLYMTAWLAQKLPEGGAVAQEVGLRIASIRNGDTTCAWRAF